MKLFELFATLGLDTSDFDQKIALSADAGRAFIADFSQAVVSLGTSAAASLGKTGDALVSLAEHGENARRIGADIAGGVAAGLAEQADTAVTGAHTTAARIIDAIAQALGIADGVSTQGMQHGAALVLGIASGAENTPFTAGGKVAQNTLTALNTAFGIKGGTADKFLSVGRAVSEGIAVGISEQVEAIVAAAARAARAAHAAAMKALNAHSPSRLMAEVGGYFSQGFAIGIEDGISGVVRAATRMTDAAARVGMTAPESAARVSPGTDALAGGIHLTQNIQAVPMSPSELAAQSLHALEMARWALA